MNVCLQRSQNLRRRSGSLSPRISQGGPPKPALMLHLRRAHKDADSPPPPDHSGPVTANMDPISPDGVAGELSGLSRIGSHAATHIRRTISKDHPHPPHLYPQQQLPTQQQSLPGGLAPSPPASRWGNFKVMGLEPSPELLAISMVYFVQGILGLSRLALQFFFKGEAPACFMTCTACLSNRTALCSLSSDPPHTASDMSFMA